MLWGFLQRRNQIRSYSCLHQTTQATAHVILTAPTHIADGKVMKSLSVFFSMGIQNGIKNNINDQLLQLQDRILKALVEEEEDALVECVDVVVDELPILRPQSTVTRSPP